MLGPKTPVYVIDVEDQSTERTSWAMFYNVGLPFISRFMVEKA